MIGFDAIGQGAVGELSGDSPDVLIFVPPALAMSAAIVAPAVAAGKSAIVPAKAAAASIVAPSVRAGVFVAVPANGAAASLGAPSVQISATVTVPAAAATAAIVAPRLDAGVSILVPSKAATGAAVAPLVTAGKQIVVPAKGATVVLSAPIVAIGLRIQPGPLAATATLPPPSILGGNYIEVSNTIVMQTPYGDIGSASIGQFALGEGDPVTRVVKRGLLAIAALQPPLVTAGKSVFVPTKTATVSLGPPEIASRRRRLRVLAIAS